MFDNKFYEDILETLKHFNTHLYIEGSTIDLVDASRIVLNRLDSCALSRQLISAIYEELVFGSPCWETVMASALLSFGAITNDVVKIVLSAEKYYQESGRHLALSDECVNWFINSKGEYLLFEGYTKLKRCVVNVKD